MTTSAELRGRELDARTAALVVTSLGEPVIPSTLRTWDARGELQSCGRDSRGRRLYRLGEVLDRCRARHAQAGHRQDATSGD